MTIAALIGALLVKPALLIAAAWGLTSVMRRASAAARHAVWTGAIAASLALPLLGLAVPKIRWSELESLLRPIASAVESVTADRWPTPARPNLPSRTGVDPSPPDVRRVGDSALEERLARPLFGIWLVVAALCIARRLLAEVRSRRLVRSGRPVSESVARLGAELARGFNVAEPVPIRISRELPAPAVAGLGRPVVLLPPVADSWSEAELHAVLVHELGHVARRDCLFNLCADVATCLYWCNPLVRFAAMRMRREGERSCDDLVLSGGADPGAYAEQLLRSARSAQFPTGLAQATTGMSRARELEHRLMAILDERVPRAAPSRSMASALAAVGMLLALPAAALTVGTAEVALAQAMLPEPDQLGDSIASPASERLPIAFRDGELERSAARALAGPDSQLAKQLVQGAAHVPTHEGDLVRDRSAWALSRAALDGRLVDPLLDALRARDWREQAYAAWALGLAGDQRAVPRLVPLVRHPVWRLRAMAAYALAVSRDRRALDAMVAALSDPAWQVRAQAVEFLASLGDAELEPLVRPRLADRHIAVRLAAQRALAIP